ncbi:MAG: hypothetical protein COA41_07190 [Sphingopyxis sp.]|nr:MAG: hypothetical protein COA41_07190 [Sphingopyxis sp.]
MMKDQEQLIAEWKTQLASARKQLGNFESGKMRWKINGVDRSDHHIAMLKKVIETIEKMLDIYAH